MLRTVFVANCKAQVHLSNFCIFCVYFLQLQRLPGVCFRNKYDRLAYAVHAFLLADGYKLVATGTKADVSSTGA